jgi:MSHA biogenesis protein MshL
MAHRPPISPTAAAALLLAAGLAGCATVPPGGAEPDAHSTSAQIRQIVAASEDERSATTAALGAAPAAAQPQADEGLPPALAAALLPPSLADKRFSVNFASVLPEVAFLAILRDSPLSIAIDPSLKTPLTIALREVTVREALEILRELHGFDYQLVGRQLIVKPGELQTRMYRVSYPVFNRNGRSEIRVVSGSITGGGGPGAGAGPTGVQNPSAVGGIPQAAPPQSPMMGAEASRVTTSLRNDVWAEIEQSVRLIVGDKDGRNVVTSPQTGTIIVRGMPKEQRAVASYLESARLSIERQVMLEAKIVEVQLRQSVATGINWAAFRNASQRISAGVINPGTTLSASGAIGSAAVTANLPGQALAAASTLPGGLLGMAIQASNFAAVLEFLGTQGNVQVLSSPRIATMNNQKAVLKVGTDDFFVTNISTTTSSTGNTSQTSPNITVQPFFSGIALDVTPHIDDQGYIVLHVHPAVSNVGERNKVLNLGSLGSFTLPLASSDVSETDSVVRARDGRIIAIGGLMRTESRNASSGLPGLGNGPLRSLLGGRTEAVTDKRELVILLKPTIVDPSTPDAGKTDPLARIEQMLREGEARPTTGDRPAATAPAAAVPAAAAPPAVSDVAPAATITAPARLARGSR